MSKKSPGVRQQQKCLPPNIPNHKKHGLMEMKPFSFTISHSRLQFLQGVQNTFFMICLVDATEANQTLPELEIFSTCSQVVVQRGILEKILWNSF